MLQIAGVHRMSILKPDAGPAGADLEIGVVSEEVKLLQNKAEEISNYLKTIPGVKDVRHDQEPGKLEYKYELNDTGRRLGLTQTHLTNAVRSGFLGNEVVHVTWNQDRIPVEGIANFGKGLPIKRLGDIDAGYPRTEMRFQR